MPAKPPSGVSSRPIWFRPAIGPTVRDGAGQFTDTCAPQLSRVNRRAACVKHRSLKPGRWGASSGISGRDIGIFRLPGIHFPDDAVNSAQALDDERW